jgi:hypothetical protein
MARNLQHQRAGSDPNAKSLGSNNLNNFWSLSKRKKTAKKRIMQSSLALFSSSKNVMINTRKGLVCFNFSNAKTS